MEGLTVLAERDGQGGDRKCVLKEGDLDWALRNVQEPTRWASVIDSFSPGLPSPSRWGFLGAGLDFIDKTK